MAAAFSTAIISTIVPRRAREGGPLHQRLRVPRRQVAGDDVNSWATPRWVTGMPASAGHGDRAADAGDHGDRHAGLAAGQHLLVAAAEDEAVAALEPHHPLARLRPLDEDAVDLLLAAPRGRAAAWRRRRARCRRAARRAARAAPAGRRPRRRPPSAPCGRRPRSARGRPVRRRRARRPATARAGARRGDRALAQAVDDLVAQRGAARVARGSRWPSTATVSPVVPARRRASTRSPRSASSARTQKIRRRSAAAPTRC